MPKRPSKLIYPVGLVLLTLAVYIPAIRSQWIWDDDRHIVQNIHLRTPHGLGQIWSHIGAVPQYYPATHTTFWIEYHLWKDNPLGYHADNILLHAANALLIGWLLVRLQIPGAWLAAAIWAVHPLQVETVVWASERKNLLSGFFYLLALHAAAGFWLTDADAGRSRAGWTTWLTCFVLFVFALLAKSVTASLPAVVLLLSWLKGRQITRRMVFQLLPFFVAALAMGSLTGWMERHVVGATGRDWSFTLQQRILIASHAVWFYLCKIIWPIHQSFIYAKWPLDPVQWFCAASLISIVAGPWILRHRLGRAPLAGILFFIGTLFPALGFVNVYPMRYSYAADHFQYLACLGPIILIAAAVVRYAKTAILGCVLLIPLIGLTERRIDVFGTPQNLWADAVANNPACVIGYSSLGSLEAAGGHPRQAEADLRRAVDIDPTCADAWVGLAFLYEQEGRLPEAIQQFQTGADADPTSPLPPFYLAEALAAHGDVPAAIESYHRSAGLFPNPAQAYLAAGQLEMQSGDIAAASADFHKALDADPNLPAAYANLSRLALHDLSIDRTDEAIAYCAAALAIDPEEVASNNNMGVALTRRGEKAKAAEYFRRALRADPNFAAARDNLRRLGELGG